MSLSSPRSTVVYALSASQAGEVRYIGKTVDLYRRLVDHRNSKGKAHKDKWLRALARQGISPHCEVLEVVPEGGDWELAERQWIEFYRLAGANLTNHSDGGDGRCGSRQSLKTRRIISQCSKRAWSGEPGKRRRVKFATKVGKLTDQQVRDIRTIPEKIGVTRGLAREYGVSHCLISEVRNRKRYKHVV